MKKHKVSKAKPKKYNFKMLLAGLALFLAVGGYALYRNSVEIPSINLADGLEAEEAAFLSKTAKKSVTGVVKAPLVKVTVRNETTKQDVTAVVRLKNKEEQQEIQDNNPTVKDAYIQDLKAEVLSKGIATDAKTGSNTVVQKVADPVSPAANGDLLVGTPAVTGTGTCSTNGSPVTVGTWVSTGAANGDTRDGVEGRKCVMCGEKGYEGSMDCRDVMAQGKPIVLPTGGGLAYTGYKEEISSCIGKKDGSFINIAVGQKGDAGYCGPDGKIYAENDAKTKLNEYCTKIKTNSTWDGSKCAAKTADKLAEPTKDEIAASIIACEKVGKYHISGTTKCGVDKPKDQGKPNGESNITLITCMVGGQKKVYPAGTDCSKIAGSVESIMLLNTVNKNSKNLGGEIVSTPAECRYGGAPLVNDRNLSTQTICFDYTKKLPSNTSTPVKSNPAAGTIFSNPKDSNELTARRDCEAAKTAGYECKSVGFDKYQLVLISKTAKEINPTSVALSLQNSSGKISGEVDDPNDCKYTPAAKHAKTDKWVCPTEQTVAQFTPKSNERPEGQKSYVAPGNKLYNGGSCYNDNGACLSGYCEVKFGFNKCANPTQSGPEYDQEVVRKVDEIYAQVKASGKCTNTNIDTGIRINCDMATNEPIISYCDQGNGNFDENGVCNPSSQDISIIREAAKIQRAEENTINGAVGLTAICSLAIGAGLVFAPASLGGSLSIPVAICGTAGVAGGVLGYFGAK